MGGKLADAKVEQQQLELGRHGERGGPDVLRTAAPQLHWAAGPAVLLLPVREEARRQLRESHRTVSLLHGDEQRFVVCTGCKACFSCVQPVTVKSIITLAAPTDATLRALLIR